MSTVQRSTFAERLSQLYRYGFGESPYSAICVLGKKVAQCLTSENVSADEFVCAYVATVKKFIKEDAELCLEDYRDLHNAEQNLIAQMWNIAAEIVSKEFSEEARVAFQRLLDSLFRSIPCPSDKVN